MFGTKCQMFTNKDVINEITNLKIRNITKQYIFDKYTIPYY